MKNTLQVTETETVSMSSLEIVQFINSRRPEGSAELRHADFLGKVLKVLGLEYSENFRSTYVADNGKENPCYRFPKRESMLMAMSYDYAAQAAIYDRWQELENQVRLPAVTADHSELLVEINTRLAKIEETQVPKRGQQSTEGWNNHHKRDLARVQAEIKSLKSEIKTRPPTPTAEHSERIYLKRLIQQELVLEELIQRNGQYHALWLTHRAWADQVRLLSDRARRLEDCADSELADDLTDLFNSFFSPIEMES